MSVTLSWCQEDSYIVDVIVSQDVGGDWNDDAHVKVVVLDGPLVPGITFFRLCGSHVVVLGCL